MLEEFDIIGYGIEHNYIDVLPVENNEWLEYRINPRKILSEDLLHKFLLALADGKFTVAYDTRNKVYYASNKDYIKAQRNEETTKHINNREQVDKVCDECLEPYLNLRNNYIGSVLAISEIAEIDPMEVGAILCSKLYEEIESYQKDVCTWKR